MAIDILERQTGSLSKDWIPILEDLIIRKSWWDTVDALSTIVGELFLKFPEMTLPTTRIWMDSGNRWLQRVCLIFQRKYKNKTDWPLMKKYILEIAGSNEFFVQKGAGWALREYSKTNPRRVKDFVTSNDLPALTVREALKLLKTSI